MATTKGGEEAPRQGAVEKKKRPGRTQAADGRAGNRATANAPAPEEGVPVPPRRASRKAGRAAPRGPDLHADLRAFASARPQGWDHQDWLAFLDRLRERGHEVADADTIGLALERERLGVVLGQIPGLGPRRVAALVDRFDTLWSACQASVDEIAAVPGMPRSLAHRVAATLHGGS